MTVQKPHIRQEKAILTAEQKRQYDSVGFLVFERYFGAQDVAAFSRAADELLTRVGPIRPGNPRIQVDEFPGDPSLQYRVRQVWPVVDISETFARLAADERMVGLFRSLFDGDTPVLFEDKLNYKYPRGGSPFAMHQDASYWYPYPRSLASALIYIDEATEENGCLEVAPGWHTKGILARTDMKISSLITDHHIPPDVLDPAQAVKAPGPPGTLILFSCLTPHASAPNLSDRPRRAIILTYNPARDGDHYAAESGANGERSRAWLSESAHRPPAHLAGRQQT